MYLLYTIGVFVHVSNATNDDWMARVLDSSFCLVGAFWRYSIWLSSYPSLQRYPSAHPRPVRIPSCSNCRHRHPSLLTLRRSQQIDFGFRLAAAAVVGALSVRRRALNIVTCIIRGATLLRPLTRRVNGLIIVVGIADVNLALFGIAN